MISITMFPLQYLKHSFHDSDWPPCQQVRNISYPWLHNKLPQNLLAENSRHYLTVSVGHESGRSLAGWSWSVVSLLTTINMSAMAAVIQGSSGRGFTLKLCHMAPGRQQFLAACVFLQGCRMTWQQAFCTARHSRESEMQHPKQAVVLS